MLVQTPVLHPLFGCIIRLFSSCELVGRHPLLVPPDKRFLLNGLFLPTELVTGRKEKG
jgi:hypothetical protein